MKEMHLYMFKMYTLFVWISLFACTFGQTSSSCERTQADVVFLLDVSDNARPRDFRSELDLVSNVTNSLTIGPGDVRVRIVTFASAALTELSLHDSNNVSSVQEALQKVSQRGGTSDMAAALKYVRQHSLQVQNGGRGHNATQLVVVLTAGQPSSPFDTAAEATKLQSAGPKVMAVGIGPNLTRAELSNIASYPSLALPTNGTHSLTNVASTIEQAVCGSRTCNTGPVDLVFVLDSSTSLGVDNFRLAQDFAAALVRRLDVGPGANDVKVGVVTYTSTGKSEFFLNTHTDAPSLLAAISGVHYRSGTSATSEGLKQTDYYQFSPYNGMRQNSRKLMILLSDGTSDDASATYDEAYQLKKRGIEIVTVGLGPAVSPYELYSIASDMQHSLILSGHDAMATTISKVKDILCNNISKQLTTTPTECGDKLADIVFLLDSSASEGSDNFMRQVDFVRDVVKQFTIGPRDVQVGVVVFSTYVHREFRLNRWADRQSLLTALGTVRYRPGSTQTATALDYVRQNCFSAVNGGRSNSDKLVIVITDGRSTNPRQTVAAANVLKNVTDVISIGVGVGVDQVELQTIATDSDHALPVANFDALRMIKIKLTHLICQGSGHK